MKYAILKNMIPILKKFLLNTEPVNILKIKDWLEKINNQFEVLSCGYCLSWSSVEISGQPETIVLVKRIKDGRNFGLAQPVLYVDANLVSFYMNVWYITDFHHDNKTITITSSSPTKRYLKDVSINDIA